MCREKAGGQDEMRMLRAMYAEGEERLRQAGIEEAGLDAWYLLEFVTGVGQSISLCSILRECRNLWGLNFRSAEMS